MKLVTNIEWLEGEDPIAVDITWTSNEVGNV